MDELIIITPEKFRQLLRDAVQEGVSRALKQQAANTSAYMDEEEAGNYLGISPITLRTWRVSKKGPKYHKLGRLVRYAKSDLDEWMKTYKMLTIDSLDIPHGKAY